mgnify:FL=1
MVAIAGHKKENILRAVQDMYTQVAQNPAQVTHCLLGRAAARLAGYSDAQLENLPESAIESFAGVANPFLANAIRAGDTVLDIGSGSGTDVLIAARAVGPTGKVLALDMTEAMRAKLRANLKKAGIGNVEIVAGEMEAIPLPDESVDVVTSNGVLNMAPDKGVALAEIFRVLKPGGRLQLADIALGKAISFKYKQDPQLWAECIVGAVEEDKYLEMLRAAGFRDVEAIGHLDYFAANPNPESRKVAELFNAHSLVIRATKAAGAELERLKAADTPFKRALARFAKECAGVAGAGVAAAICAGVAPLVAALGALGAGAFTSHAYMFPVFVGFIAWNVWLLWRSGRARSHLGPFWLALASGAVAVVTFWLAVVGLVPAVWWWPNVGMGLLVVASLWSLLKARKDASCVDDMVREAALRGSKPAFTRQVANGAALSIAAAAAFYGMYKSVDTFVPKADAAEIACYGINGCKGQTACATAHNACPGLNSCKGRGFLHAAPKECADRGGVPLKGSPADPTNKAA